MMVYSLPLCTTNLYDEGMTIGCFSDGMYFDAIIVCWPSSHHLLFKGSLAFFLADWLWLFSRTQRGMDLRSSYCSPEWTN